MKLVSVQLSKRVAAVVSYRTHKDITSVMSDSENRKIFAELKPGDRIRLKHEVKVGFRTWDKTTEGIVERTERRRHGLHTRRNHDDKVYSDSIVLRLDDGSLTTVTLDAYSVLEKLESAPASESSTSTN